MLKEFYQFDKFITPTMIHIIFWLGVGFYVLSGLSQIFSSFSMFGSPLNFLIGLIWLVVGPIFTKVFCEIVLVIFKIKEHLQNINQSLNPNKDITNG
jgi:hypothetical protein